MKIRNHLDAPTAEEMLHCSITPRRGFCNSPLNGARATTYSSYSSAITMRSECFLPCKFDLSSPEEPTLAACWTKNRIQTVAAHSRSSPWWSPCISLPFIVSVYSKEVPAMTDQKSLQSTKMPFGRVWQTLLCVWHFTSQEPSPYTYLRSIRIQPVKCRTLKFP